MARPKDLGLEHTWRRRRRRQAASGLSIPEFCSRRDLIANPRSGASRLQDLARSDLTGESAPRRRPVSSTRPDQGRLAPFSGHCLCDADRQEPGRVAEPGPIVPRQVSARDLLRPEIGRDD